MPALWGYALYCPAGRLTDWFRRPSDCPSARTYRRWRSVEIECLRQYIGAIDDTDAARLFRLANRTIYDLDACRSSRQAQYRDPLLAASLDDLADVPQVWPAD